MPDNTIVNTRPRPYSRGVAALFATGVPPAVVAPPTSDDGPSAPGAIAETGAFAVGAVAGDADGLEGTGAGTFEGKGALLGVGVVAAATGAVLAFGVAVDGRGAALLGVGGARAGTVAALGVGGSVDGIGSKLASGGGIGREGNVVGGGVAAAVAGGGGVPATVARRGGVAAAVAKAGGVATVAAGGDVAGGEDVLEPSIP
ncbi:circumsporozoite protein-like [Salvia splendens]|uniref:circumsporozoite protein-like n=1 Tax=Salvia splendens TaxID=180675 RepID=UPI001C27915E|nr:circumsporozoite protein-like [Salvia splendens]